MRACRTLGGHGFVHRLRQPVFARVEHAGTRSRRLPRARIEVRLTWRAGTYYAGWHSISDNTVGDIAQHERTGAHDGLRSDGNAVYDLRTETERAVVANSYSATRGRRGRQTDKVAEQAVMVYRGFGPEEHAGSREAIVTDDHAGHDERPRSDAGAMRHDRCWMDCCDRPKKRALGDTSFVDDSSGRVVADADEKCGRTHFLRAGGEFVVAADDWVPTDLCASRESFVEHPDDLVPAGRLEHVDGLTALAGSTDYQDPFGHAYPRNGSIVAEPGCWTPVPRST